MVLMGSEVDCRHTCAAHVSRRLRSLLSCRSRVRCLSCRAAARPVCGLDIQIRVGRKPEARDRCVKWPPQGSLDLVDGGGAAVAGRARRHGPLADLTDNREARRARLHIYGRDYAIS